MKLEIFHRCRSTFFDYGGTLEKEQELADTFCARSEQSDRLAGDVPVRMKPLYYLGIVSTFYGNPTILLNEPRLLQLLDVVADSGRLGMTRTDT